MSGNENNPVCNNSMCQVELHNGIEIKKGLCWGCLKEKSRGKKNGKN
jgi:hypothetical protein